MSPRIGDILITRGLLDADQLEHALSQQRRTGERLGRVVLTLGLISRVDLAKALAERWQRPFIMVTPEMVQPALARRFPLDATLAFRAVPLSDDGTTVLVASGEEPSPELHDTLTVVYPGRAQDIRITTEWDIDRAIGIAHHRQMLDASIHGLYFRDQDESAYRIFSPGQTLLFALALIGFSVTLWRHPIFVMTLTTVAASLGFATPTLFRLLVGLSETPAPARIEITPESMQALPDRSLPTYSVLVPFEGESDQVEGLLDALRSLDYPADKLDIILLFHENDAASLATAKAASPGANVRLLMVPAAEMHTKPMACNVGLLYARGEYVVVYHPTDRPDADQLRKAVTAFRRAPRRLVCLQATLRPRQTGKSVLSQFAAIDQAFWLDHLLPGLNRWRLPVPVGGSSNHFRAEMLRSLGGWDPFNVTEDADLGVRASMQSLRAGAFNSTTSVLLPPSLTAWLRERIRWITGLMQTALLYLRDPIALTRSLGVRRSAGFTFLIAGTPFGYLMLPLATALMTLWLTVGLRGETLGAPPWALDLALLSLLLGYGSVIAIHLFTALRHRLYGQALLAPLAPLYWLLLSIPTVAGVVQLLLRPSRDIPRETLRN